MRARWLVLALTACATSERMGDRVNPETPLWYTHPSGDLDVFARRQLTMDTRVAGEPYEHGRPELDTAHNRVFVGSSDRGLYALRSSNLSTIWRFETANIVQCEPLYDRELDVVYFGSNDGGLYAVRASDGVLVYRFNSGFEIGKKPVLYGESLIFANASDQLFSIERRTGKLQWQVHRSPAAGMELAGYSGPALDHGKVYFAFSDGHVGAFDARDGSEKWSPVDLAAVQVQPRSAAGLLTRAMLVSLTNPKTLLFHGAFFPQFLSADRPVAPQAAALSLVFLALALLVDGTWALVAARARPLLARGVRLGRLSGGLLIGAGLGLAFARPK